MGISAGVSDVYLRLATSGQLKIGVYAHLSADPATSAEALRRGPLKVGGTFSSSPWPPLRLRSSSARHSRVDSPRPSLDSGYYSQGSSLAVPCAL